MIAKLLKSKKFRDAYVYEHVRNGIPFQTRALREQRDWTQADLGEASKKPRNVITRLENPNYGKLTLKTLFEIASGCDVALLVKFVPFSRLLKEYEDVSSEALYAKSITDEEEIEELNEWTAEEEAEPIAATSPFQVLEGGRNTTPTQQRLGFMYRVEDQDSSIRDLLGKREQSEVDKEKRERIKQAKENPLAMAASSGGRR